MRNSEVIYTAWVWYTFFFNKNTFFGAISLKKSKITDAGHIIEGKKKKIRKVNNIDTSSERDKSQRIRHMNSLENQYIDKLPKLPNAQNDSHVVLPKIYLTNLKIEQKTERKTGSMPDSKKINENSFSNKANDSNIYKKKTVHNKTKLQSLSKDELTKVFNKYRAKISCENTPSNELQSNPIPSKPHPELQTKPPPKIQEKSSFKEQSPKAKAQVEENLPNEKSPKAKPKETGGFSKKTSIDKSNELPPKKDGPKKSLSGAEGVMKQGSQKNVENGENQKAKETEIKKEEVKEPEKGKEGKIEESPIKENGNLELSPVKKEGSEEGKEYEEEIFEDPVEKN